VCGGREGPRFSFIGIPPKEVLDECRTIASSRLGRRPHPRRCGTSRAGVDAIVASGFEAGGHRGSFLRPQRISLKGTFSAGPANCRQGQCAVDRCGRHSRCTGVVAALALGAEAVQIGTDSGLRGIGAGVLIAKLCAAGSRTHCVDRALREGARGIQIAEEELTSQEPRSCPIATPRTVRSLSIAAEAAAGRTFCLCGPAKSNLSTCTNLSAFLTHWLRNL